MRRRLAVLSLLPVLLLGSATQAAAAGGAPAAPGFTINKVEHVVTYRAISWDAETGDLVDGGSVRLDYTCRPGGLWGETATVHLYVDTGSSGFSTQRLGDDVPCDGARHKVELPVSRLTSSPYDPGVKLAGGSRPCSSCRATSARAARRWSTGRCRRRCSTAGTGPSWPGSQGPPRHRPRVTLRGVTARGVTTRGVRGANRRARCSSAAAATCARSRPLAAGRAA